MDADDLRAAADNLVERAAGLLAGVAAPTGTDDRAPTAIAKRAVPSKKGSAILASSAEGAVSNTQTLPTAAEVSTLFTQHGALVPPYDPDVLVTLYEHSNSLRPNVDAYATNIEGFGYRLEPVVKLDASDADEVVGDAIYLERLRDAERAMMSGTPTNPVPAVAQAAYPTAEEIGKRKDEIKAIMRLERARLENFFEHVCVESSFIELRKQRREDIEVTGNAYWEVLRNGAGEIAQFVYVPTNSVRIGVIDQDFTDVVSQQKVSAFTYEPLKQQRRFRRFLQIVLNRVVYFKEFGDPRVMSKKTGRHYDSVDALKAADRDDSPATEILHFRLHSPRTPYGIPRWIGNLVSVLGSRSAEEVNYLYFDNKAVPPLAVLVSGGRLSDAGRKKIESYVKDHIRGKENFHKILIIEAEAQSSPAHPMADNGRVRIQIEKLTSEQQQDALFQSYDERNIDKVGTSFRMPRLLRGDVRDFNRATADAALQFAETQVFQGEREGFDALMNRRVLQDLKVRFWRFVSNSPIARDPGQLAEMTASLANAGIITIAEGRDVAKDIYNRDFKRIDALWAHQPLVLTQAGVLPAEEGMPTAPGTVPGVPDAAAPPVPPGGKAAAADPYAIALARAAQNLVLIRDRLRAHEGEVAAREFKSAKRAADDAGVITIKLTAEEIESLVEKE